MSGASDRWGRAANAAFVVLLAYFLATAVGAAVVQGALWDLYLFQPDAVDATWRLELAWRAWRGDWSGVDFQYPRGPLWQLYGLVAMQIGRGLLGDGVGWPLALIDAGFHITTLLALAWIARTRVAAPAARVAVFLAFCLLSRVMGSATLRGFFPLIVVLLYAPPDLGRPGEGALWRAPLRAAVMTIVVTLFGFDRLYSAGLCVGAAAAFEWAVRARRGHDPADALRRLGYYGVGSAAGLVMVGLVVVSLGGHPLDALGEHAAINAAYAAHMSLPWDTGVPRAVIGSLFLTLVALAWMLGWRRDKEQSLAGSLWLIGAAPAATFALIRADAGHLIVSLLPAFGALLLVAAGADVRLTRGARQIATGIAVLGLFGWFATHPEQVGGDPRVFIEVVDVARGERRPSAAHRTDYGNAMRWARARMANEPPETCIAVHAGLTLLHPALDRRGPTELALRWSDEMKRALAEGIERDDCPYFVYWEMTRAQPRLTWPFGVDFVRIAQQYELDSPAGVAILGLRRRQTPLEVERAELAPAQAPRMYPEGEPHRIPLRDVTGRDLVTLEVTLDVDRWRPLAGGAPRLEWRFEREGEPIGEWSRFYGLSYGRPSRVHVSPEARVTELHFIAGREPEPGVLADALALRLTAAGVASPSSARITVGAIESVRLVDATPPEPPRCERDVNLAARLAMGGGHTRHGAPIPSLRYFDLEPEPGRDPPEVVFPITPCEGTCVRAQLHSHQDAGRGDGAVGELFVRDGPTRVHIAGAEALAGDAPIAVEASLEPWAGRPVELEFTAWPGQVVGEDRLRFFLPVIRPCMARQSLAELVTEGSTAMVEGRAIARGDDVEFAAPGGQLEQLLRVVRDTCFEAGFALEGPPDARARMSIRIADGDVIHVLDERVVQVGEPVPLRRHWLTEFATRDVVFVFAAHPVPDSPVARPRLVAPRFSRCEEQPP